MNNSKTCPVCGIKGLDSRYKWCPHCGSWLRGRQYQSSLQSIVDSNPALIDDVQCVVDKIHIPYHLK